MLLVVLGMTGCSHTDVYRGLYEGLRARAEMVNPSPAYGTGGTRPSYEQYDAERRRRLGPAE